MLHSYLFLVINTAIYSDWRLCFILVAVKVTWKQIRSTLSKLDLSLLLLYNKSFNCTTKK